jgi:hypothetical protein
MRRASVICAMVMLATPLSSLACKVLAGFPEHLEIDDSKYYYLVRVERAKPDGYSGTVKRSFGGAFPPGQKVDIKFRVDEEAHAVCPIEIVPGMTYLLRSESAAGPLEISRFDWLNVSAGHKKFSVYVQDLERSQGRR